MVLVVFDQHHLPVEIGQVLFDRIIDVHFAFVHEHHQSRSRHGLRHRGDPKQIVRLHLLLAGNIGEANRFQVEHFVARRDKRHGAGERMTIDKMLQAVGDALGPFLRCRLSPRNGGHGVDGNRRPVLGRRSRIEFYSWVFAWGLGRTAVGRTIRRGWNAALL